MRPVNDSITKSMRKIFTLFAAIATLVSVAAPSQFVKKTNIKYANPVQVRHITPQSGQKPAKVAIAPASTAPFRMYGQTAAIGKASGIRRAHANYECTYSECTYEDYGSDTWFSITTNDEAYKFYFDLRMSASAIEMEKTYTMADCDPSFTYLSDNTTYQMTPFTDLALVFSKDAEGDLILEAQCTTEDEDVYHLKYVPQEIPETFTDVEVSDIPIRFYDFTKESNLFQFTGKNDVYDIGLCVKSKSEIEGSWTKNDMDATYTYLKKGDKNVKLHDITLQVKSLGANNYHIDAKMYAYDGNVYIINHDYIEPTLQNTAAIAATNLQVDEDQFEFYKGMYGYGVADITASNDDYMITGSIMSYTTIAGHYDDQNHMLNELFITDLATGKKTDFFSSDLDIAKAGDSWTLKGKVLCWDGTEYSLDLSFAIPDVKGEASFTSTDGELNDQTAELGAFQIFAMDENWNEFSIALPAEAVASGHYSTLSEENKGFCYIYYDSKKYPMYSANFDLDTNGETFTLTGSCQAGDLLWNVSITGTFLSSADSFDATPEDGEIDVNFSLDDIYAFEIATDIQHAFLQVVNKERKDVWMCEFILNGDDLTPGEYPIEMSYQPGTVLPGEIDDNLDLYPTAYYRLDEAGYAALPVWFCTYGTVKVDYDETGNIVIDCDALNSNYVRVHVTVNAGSSSSIQKVSNANMLKNGKFLENNRIVIRNQEQMYNTLGQQVK